ncbi:hypothetical protein HPB51_005764 [Rhipicephalus microplus]|uniref:Ionotropic glutamate receptor C-terminal domain-containing protein n=1 Tax=Rhipicephalus microplus TaxID=6941 RepID=A0A9J6DSX7_RHIMP|nr:hypothetical protein HPB51_005764 [Rhipicephalus microplus]
MPCHCRTPIQEGGSTAVPAMDAKKENLPVWLGLLVCWPLMSALISFIQAVRSPLRFKDTFTRNLFDILGIMMFEGTALTRWIPCRTVVPSRSPSTVQLWLTGLVLRHLLTPVPDDDDSVALADWISPMPPPDADKSSRQWCLVLALMQPCSVRPVRDVIGRVVFAVWWLAVLVLMNSFQGNMKASMSVKTPTERLETFRDLAERPHLKPIIIRGTTFEHQFKVSPEWELQRILTMARAHRSILPAPVVFRRDTFDEMIAKRAVVFMEDNVMQSYIAALYPHKPGSGTIYPSKQHTISAQFCMFMRKSLQPRIVKLLHTRCRWMHESGLTEKKRLELQPRSWYPSRPDSSKVHSLSAEDTAALFYLMLLGQAVAVIVFLGEILARHLTSKTSLA